MTCGSELLRRSEDVSDFGQVGCKRIRRELHHELNGFFLHSLNRFLWARRRRLASDGLLIPFDFGARVVLV